ncbi:EAL domain-containing response regulator [Marinobacter sp. SS21]|uniref:EAL domain-containing response regulator n=1 Tax=Marinobacter sp. SS21 TaxID=2979460 RepID=UPI00232B9790|nr:response regulator [Marinobacter sp. SS21]MDC0663690.1 response regulator [Marinobacter sp. SS21]
MAGVDLGQKYEELKQQYVRSLPKRLDELRTVWNRLQHVSWDTKALTFMEQCAHKLSGSGATFQFPEISHCARVLEAQLRQMLNKPDANPSERNQIEASLRGLERALDQAINTATPQSVAIPPVKAVKSHHRIAVIEDDLSQAAFLKAWLDQRGFTVEIFETPEAYSRRTDDHSHHLILLDLSFPEGALEGIAWLERLKSQLDANTPVIMMSARSDMVARMRALRAGADTYLTKPLDLEALENRINQLLANTTTTRPRVLWVDDDTDLLAYYKILLSDEGYEVEGLSQPVRILERVEQFQPDAIVLDQEMPGVQGVELARVLRQDARFMTIPILFVSASQSVSEQLEQHSMAGNEVFRKPLDNKQFLAALQHHLAQAQRITARINLVSQRKERQGLQNHDYFLTELATLLAYIEVKPDNQSRYLLQLGICREAYLRAQYGARALARLTARMEHHFANQLGTGDSGCALGGGSFLFQVNAPAVEDASAFLESFYQRLNSANWCLGEPPIPVALSMGVLPLTEAMNEDKALLEVEQACGEAMQTEGGCVVWQQAPERSEDSKLDERIRELLEARAFKLHYQPIVNMDSGDTLFEALVRLVDENDAVYLPGQFMPQMADGNHGTLHDLDCWVIEHAVSELSKQTGKAAASHSVAIKLSTPMAEVAKMVPHLRSGMRNARIEGKRRIYLALSNPAVIKDVARAKQLLNALRDMECGLIIEHVDTSTASVELLKELRSVDFVKLAPKYGANAEQTPALENLLNQLSATFGSSLPVVATRVEDAKALAWFWDRGIRNFQGHFIQAPEVAMNFEF